MGEGRSEAHSVGRDKDSLTIAEAATLLGVHKNTIRNRIKNGTYKAETVVTERGPTYVIERSSLLTNLNTNTLSTASQDIVSPQGMEFFQELLRPFVSELGEVREELGAERARREIEQERREIAEQRATIAEARAADLEAKLGNLEPTADPNYEEPPFEEQPEVRRPWWRRLFG
jgi:excisionase family DNA binding protein